MSGYMHVCVGICLGMCLYMYVLLISVNADE